MCRHCLREGLSAAQVVAETNDGTTQAGMFDTLAEIAQTVEQGQARPGQLFEVETEVEQFPAWNARPDPPA